MVVTRGGEGCREGFEYEKDEAWYGCGGLRVGLVVKNWCVVVVGGGGGGEGCGKRERSSFKYSRA